MTSNYKQVVEFNNAFGVDSHNTPKVELFKEDPKLVNYRVIDALTDILYVTYGAFTAFGIDADKAFNLVHKSNMSKLCKTEKEAQDTVEWYKQHESERYDSPAYRLSDDNIHYVVYNISTKKILKSIYYSPVKFDSLMN